MRAQVLCYDIPDDRRRRRMARLLEGYAMRVQYSVFEGDLDAGLLEQVKLRAGGLIDAETDRLTVYVLCERCARAREDLGLTRAGEDWGDSVVIVV